MCFLKSRKQLNNHIIWLAKYRRTSLGFFPRALNQISMWLCGTWLLLELLLLENPFTLQHGHFTHFVPPCEIHHLVGIHFYSACAWAMRTWEKLKTEHWMLYNSLWPLPVNVCSCFKAAGSHTRSVYLICCYCLISCQLWTKRSKESHHI